MNLKKWNSLPENDKFFMQKFFKGLALDSLLKPHYEDRIAYSEAVKAGAEPIAWSDEEKAKVRAYARDIWKDIADKSEIGKMYYDALQQFLQSQGMN